MTFIPGATSLDNLDGKDVEAINWAGSSLGTATTVYYTDMNQHRSIAAHLDFTAGAGGGTFILTLLASCEDVADSSATYFDVTSTYLGAATITADMFKTFNTGGPIKWLKWNIAITNASNNSSIEFIVRKGW